MVIRNQYNLLTYLKDQQAANSHDKVLLTVLMIYCHRQQLTHPPSIMAATLFITVDTGKIFLLNPLI